jgi:general secretion pathway protein C
MTKRYHTIFNLLALSVVIYTGVDLFYSVVCARLRQIDTKTFVAQHIPDDKVYQKPPLDNYRVIIDRNIFGSVDRTLEEVKAEEIEALEPTSLKIALLGTVTGRPQNAVAVIEETNKKKQGLYKVGDGIQNAIIKMILRGKVILRVENRDEILTMEEVSVPSTENVPQVSRPISGSSSITVRRSDIETSIENINELLSQVRIRPHFRDGKPDGLRLGRIKRGSLFEKLGLRNGDIIQRINDGSITSPDDILALCEELESGSLTALQIDRRGEKKTINYRFR